MDTVTPTSQFVKINGNFYNSAVIAAVIPRGESEWEIKFTNVAPPI
jgi:hypothetical protein